MSVKIFLEFHSFCLSVNVYGVGHSITANVNICDRAGL